MSCHASSFAELISALKPLSAEAALAALHDASRRLELPVDVDRELRELSESSLDSSTIVQRVISSLERRP